MEQTEYEQRYRAINSPLQQHEVWMAAARDVRASDWLDSVVHNLMVLGEGEDIEYLETRGLPEAGATATIVAYTRSRRIDLQATFRHGPAGGEVSASAMSRGGLQSVEVMSIGGVGGTEWPTALVLRVKYEGEEPRVLGSRQGAESDFLACRRLVSLYPSLLADLNRP